MAKNVKISTIPNNNVITDVKDFGKHLKYKPGFCNRIFLV